MGGGARGVVATAAGPVTPTAAEAWRSRRRPRLLRRRWMWEQRRPPTSGGDGRGRASSTVMAVSPLQPRQRRPTALLRLLSACGGQALGVRRTPTGSVATVSRLAAAPLPAAVVATPASPAWSQSDLWGRDAPAARAVVRVSAPLAPAYSLLPRHGGSLLVAAATPSDAAAPSRREAIKAAAVGQGAGAPDCRSRQQPR